MRVLSPNRWTTREFPHFWKLIPQSTRYCFFFWTATKLVHLYPWTNRCEESQWKVKFWASPWREGVPERTWGSPSQKASMREVKIFSPGGFPPTCSRKPTCLPALSALPRSLWGTGLHSKGLVLGAKGESGPYSGRWGSRSTSSRRRPRALPRSTRGSRHRLGFWGGKRIYPVTFPLF